MGKDGIEYSQVPLPERETKQELPEEMQHMLGVIRMLGAGLADMAGHGDLRERILNCPRNDSQSTAALARSCWAAEANLVVQLTQASGVSATEDRKEIADSLAAELDVLTDSLMACLESRLTKAGMGAESEFGLLLSQAFRLALLVFAHANSDPVSVILADRDVGMTYGCLNGGRYPRRSETPLLSGITEGQTSLRKDVWHAYWRELSDAALATEGRLLEREIWSRHAARWDEFYGRGIWRMYQAVEEFLETGENLTVVTRPIPDSDLVEIVVRHPRVLKPRLPRAFTVAGVFSRDWVFGYTSAHGRVSTEPPVCEVRLVHGWTKRQEYTPEDDWAVRFAVHLLRLARQQALNDRLERPSVGEILDAATSRMGQVRVLLWRLVSTHLRRFVPRWSGK